MTNWDEIARENLRASQKLGDCGFFRSSVSRAYYAAFSAATSVLTGKVTFRPGREAPEHKNVTGLLEKHWIPTDSAPKRKELKASIRRLYNYRISADYSTRRTINQQISLEARRDAVKICNYLRILR